MTDNNWQGHVAVVTGAGSGIGRGIAERFAEAELAEVNVERGQQAASELRERYGKGLFVATDVSRSADCRRLIETAIQHYDHIDTLVNDAGVNFVKPTLEMTEEDWDRVINVDLKGTFLCSRHALTPPQARKAA